MKQSSLARDAAPGDAPMISVLMAAYNCAPFLRAAIESVQAQTWANWELLIVDDGSTDETPEVLAAVSDPRIRTWRRANAGRAAALNFMLGEARGRWAAILDADDLAVPERLEAAAEHLMARPDLAAVMTGHWLLIGASKTAPRGQAKTYEQCLADVTDLRPPAHDPTIVVSTRVGREVQFSEDLRVGSGIDFVFRLVERHAVEVIGAPLYVYRIHKAAVTRNNIDRRVSAVRRVFDRARERRGKPAMTEAEFLAHQGPALRDPSNNLSGHFTDSAYLQLVAGQRWGALRTALHALRADSLRPRSFKPLIYALSPVFLARKIRAS